MEKVKTLDGPNGWLIDPHNKWAIHFDCKKDPVKSVALDFTIDMWGVDTQGKPIKFKSRRKTTKKDFLKTWKQLVLSNWTEFSFGKFDTA